MTTATISPEIGQYPPPLETQAALVHEVRSGLARHPKSLSPWMFYDGRGSQLFERITTLPEYYPSRIERELLSRFADEVVALARPDPSRALRVFELGAGTAAKTGILLERAMRCQGPVTYAPCDISPEALDVACAGIEGLLPAVRLRPLVANYVTDPPQLPPGKGTTLALYIGSSIGNFSPQEARTILCNLRSQMRGGDALLLGTDMVKDEEILLAAYDDCQGVTAEFNLNVLHRLNRELGADFDLEGFRHRARWNRTCSRIEMHLESLREQRVSIPEGNLRLHFVPGETIHTENSYKFTPCTLRTLLHDAGFNVVRAWTDPLGWYSLTLAGLRRVFPTPSWAT